MSYRISPYRDDVTGEWSTNPSYQEILKLNKMLTDANIPHTLDKLFDGWQVCYPTVDERVMDAIQHYGSYGRDNDTLEIMGLLIPDEAEWDSVAGHLTAEEVFERIRKHYAGEWDDYINSLQRTTSEETSTDTSVNTTMTPEEFATQMREAYETYYVEHGDEEEVHDAMDAIMCDLLRQLGYGEGIDIFNNTPKWYA